MNEAASVFLRADIQPRDGYSLAEWMNDRMITQYLNEQNEISKEILHLVHNSPIGMFTYYFNRNGHFYMICDRNDHSIGFIKVQKRSEHRCEVVYVIGERILWGHGYGEQALDLALSKAFFDLRMEHVTARIRKENIRSIRTALHCGMSCTKEDERSFLYEITLHEYIEYKARIRAIDERNFLSATGSEGE